MSRDPGERLADIVHAIDRCLLYRTSLDSDDPGVAEMAFDAILRNLAVVGEAVRALPEDATRFAPQLPWASIAGLRNVVVHEYFRVRPELIQDIVDNELVPLRDAILAR